MSAPTQWGNEFSVNTATIADQYEARVVALADGRFVAVWYELEPEGFQEWGWTVRYQIFNADGSKSGPESDVYSAGSLNNPPVNSYPDVAARPDGGFTVTWTSKEVGGPRIAMQAFDGDGAKIGAQIFAPTQPGAGAPDHSAVASNTFTAVAWTDANNGGVWAQVYNAQGQLSGNVLQLGAASNAGPGPNDVNLVALKNGSGAFVASWTQETGNQSITHTQMFSQLGQKIGAEYQTAGSSNHEDTPTITALANGGYMVAWYDTINGFEQFRGQMFTANGAPAGAQIVIDQESPQHHLHDISLAGLNDGRVVAVWERDGGLVVQVFNADGSFDGGHYSIADGSAGLRDVDVTTLADGRIVVTWTHSNGPGDPGYGVRSQILDPRESGVDLQGSTLDDDLIGTKYDDVMRGGVGADRLDGREGNDLLIGGAGADTLIGGAGNDTASYQYSTVGVSVNLATGKGLFGDAAGDTLSGVENVIGSRYNDTLTGDAKDNILTGLSGADSLDGGAGNDTASYAGSSAGVYVDLALGKGKGGDAQGDTLIRIENLLGSSFSDTLLGDAGANVLNGGAGHDILTGREGSDTFLFEKLTDGADVITDYAIGTDKIQIFAGKPTPLAMLASMHFENGTVPGQAGATVMFDEYTGSLSYDADGNGAGAAAKLANVQLAGAAKVQSLSGVLGYAVLGTGDFNGDGTSDILLRNLNSGEARVWSMSNNQIVDSHDIGNRSGYSLVGTGDFNGDGTDDMLWKNDATGLTETWQMQNGSQNGGFVLGNMAGFTALATGDFNGDGTTDIVWRNDATGATDVWQMNNGHLGSTVSQSNTTGYDLIGTGDFNGDGTTDMLWLNKSTGVVEDWLMKNGQYDSGFTFADVSGYRLLGVGDLNHDGTTDLIWQNKLSGELSDWLFKDGKFGGGVESFGIAGPGLQQLGIGDFSHDGGNDVLWYDAATNTTRIWDLDHQRLSASDFLIGT